MRAGSPWHPAPARAGRPRTRCWSGAGGAPRGAGLGNGAADHVARRAARRDGRAREAAGDATIVETGTAGYSSAPRSNGTSRCCGATSPPRRSCSSRVATARPRPAAPVRRPRWRPPRAGNRGSLAGHGPGRRGRAGPAGGGTGHLGREPPGSARRRRCRGPADRRGPPARGAITPGPAEGPGGGRRSQRRRRRVRPLPHGARRRARRRPERRDRRRLPRDARRRRRGARARVPVADTSFVVRESDWARPLTSSPNPDW